MEMGRGGVSGVKRERSHVTSGKTKSNRRKDEDKDKTRRIGNVVGKHQDGRRAEGRERRKDYERGRKR